MHVCDKSSIALDNMLFKIRKMSDEERRQFLFDATRRFLFDLTFTRHSSL